MMATTDARIGRVMKKLTIYGWPSGWHRAKRYVDCCKVRTDLAWPGSARSRATQPHTGSDVRRARGRALILAVTRTEPCLTVSVSQSGPPQD